MTFRLRDNCRQFTTYFALSFSEFLLNHLHSNHKHRRFNGDSLDLTMVVPQLEYEITRSDLIHSYTHLPVCMSISQAKRIPPQSDGEWSSVYTRDGDPNERAGDNADVAICGNIQPQEVLLPWGAILHNWRTCWALPLALVLRWITKRPSPLNDGTCIILGVFCSKVPNPRNCTIGITWLWFMASRNTAIKDLLHRWQKAPMI